MMDQHQAGSSSAQPTALHPPAQPRTSSTGRSDERVDSQSPTRRVGSTDPFTSPQNSRPSSSYGSSDSRVRITGSQYFRSRRVKKGELEKPWLDKKDPKEKWVTIIPILGIIVGLGISGFLVWDGLRSVVKHKYCLVLADDFTSFDDAVWTKEVQVGGFG